MLEDIYLERHRVSFSLYVLPEASLDQCAKIVLDARSECPAIPYTLSATSAHDLGLWLLHASAEQRRKAGLPPLPMKAR
jgi:hypothetical protein